MSKEFKWTDELILKFVQYTLHDSPTFQGRYKDLEDFKASHSTDKIKWEAGTVVKDTWYNAEYTKQEDGSWIRSKTSPRFVITDNEIGVGLRYVPISKLLQRTKLFTTEDGVDIFEGDNFWYVTPPLRVFNDLCDSMSGGKYVAHSRVGDKFFSTKEKAEEYVLMNKPLLSVNDIVKNFRTRLSGSYDNTRLVQIAFTDLKELAKSKL